MHKYPITLKVIVIAFLLIGNYQNYLEWCTLFKSSFLNVPTELSSVSVRFESRKKLTTGIERISIILKTADTYAKGEAYFIDPNRVQVIQRVAEPMRNRDIFVDWPELGDTRSGMLIEEYVAVEGESDVLLAFNSHQGHFWEASTLLVIGGELVMKAEGKRGISQQEYQPLNGPFWTLSFDPDKPGVFPIELREGKLDGALPIQNGLSGPPLLMNGQSMLSRLQFNARPALKGNDLGWSSIDHHLAMTCYGYTVEGKLVILQLIGDPDDPIRKEPTLYQVVDILEKLGVTDAVLGGTSGDVQRYSIFDDPPVVRSPGRRGSSFQRSFPGGRPLGAAVLLLFKHIENSVEESSL